MQMIIYFSAISPCLAFTYMLRGIDVPTIFFALVYAFLTSAGLSALALLLATFTQEKVWQVLLTVFVILGTLLVFWFLIIVMLNFVNSTIDFRRWFWLGNAMGLTAYASYFVLVFLAAASQLTFSSGNRSTALRIAMSVQFLLFTAWMAWFWFYEEPGQWPLIFVYLFIGGVNWYVMGAFLTGESSQLSPRVRRRLPQSTLGRILLSWFAPGSGTGYMFVIGNYLTMLLLALFAVVAARLLQIEQPTGPGVPRRLITALPLFAILSASYAIIYLGLERVIVAWLRRRFQVSPLAPLLIQTLILAAACGIPYTIYGLSPANYGNGYSMLQATNAVWTLVDAVDGRSGPEVQFLAVVLPLVALLTVVLNLPSIAREVRLGRLLAPPRVRQEEEDLAGKPLAPLAPVPTNPWGDVPAEPPFDES
ncbi:MAG: hypothetical protein R3C10_06125 [Pirellulales bacterium]